MAFWPLVRPPEATQRASWAALAVAVAGVVAGSSQLIYRLIDPVAHLRAPCGLVCGGVSPRRRRIHVRRSLPCSAGRAI